MATTLAPVDSREVVRCDRCNLVQFRTINSLCRKCKTSLDDEPEPVFTPPAVEPAPAPGSRHLPVAQAIRSLRLRAGLSQRQLALRMSVPRTYVSKIENEKACPTLSSMERLAQALHVRIADLLNDSGRTLQDEIRELQSDEFIAELIPHLAQLNPMDRATIMNRVREMSVTPRRCA